MKNRSDVNIAFANYLYSNRHVLDSSKLSSGEYVKLDDTNHLIIGRWYYALFLLAKNTLVNDFNYIDNCSKKGTCFHSKKGRYCNGKCFKHKSAKNISSIWGILGKFLPNYNSDLLKGERLAKMREEYEYCNSDSYPRKDYRYPCDISDLENAEKLFKEIHNVFKRTKIK